MTRTSLPTCVFHQCVLQGPVVASNRATPLESREQRVSCSISLHTWRVSSAVRTCAGPPEAVIASRNFDGMDKNPAHPGISIKLSAITLLAVSIGNYAPRGLLVPVRTGPRRRTPRGRSCDVARDSCPRCGVSHCNFLLPHPSNFPTSAKVATFSVLGGTLVTSHRVQGDTFQRQWHQLFWRSVLQ